MKKLLMLKLVLGIACLLFWVSAQAQEKYPRRPIELVVPATPGGVNDTSARTYSKELGRILNTPITVVNRGGGAGTIGTSYVIRAKKDGYTLLNSSPNLVIQPIINKEVNFDPLKDLIHIGQFGTVPIAFCVREDSPFHTLGELIEYARKNPGKLKFGASGMGSVDYFNVQILASKTNIKMVAIPFRGGGQTLISLLGGNVDLTFMTLTTQGGQIKAGKIRGLATSTKNRNPEFPNIPTFTELGYPYPFIIPWFGIFSSAGLPQSVLNVLMPAVEKAFKNPELAQQAIRFGMTVDYLGPKEFRKLIESQFKTVEKIARDVNLIKK
ncbi:Bug family tripartite tricarboxylate transporter substrate binding protein [Thermodesulfobacteriota bacterium]